VPEIVRVTVAIDVWGKTSSFTYDEVGNRTRVQDAFGGVETSVYDHDNRLSTREISGISTTQMRADFTYRDDGSLDTVKRYSNVSGTTKVGETDYLYDAAGRTTGINEYNGSGTALASYAYDYDPANNVTAAVIDGTPQDYTYDADNQLLADGTTTVTYDATGNRDNGGNTPGSANQLSSDGTWSYTYNDEGDLTKKSKGASAETWTYGYDNKNELTWAEDRATDGGTLLQRVEFQYDVYGDRVQKAVDSNGDGVIDTTERYALEGFNPARGSPTGTENWDVCADLDGSSSLTTRYLRGDLVDQILGRVGSSGTAAWLLTDRQGTVRDVTDSTGALKDTISYDGYGKVTNQTDPTWTGRYTYTGRELDTETALQYNRRRYYDPATARWITEDPIGFAAGDSNLYRYVNNAPTDAQDPSGNFLFAFGQARAEKIAKSLREKYGGTWWTVEVSNPWRIVVPDRWRWNEAHAAIKTWPGSEWQSNILASITSWDTHRAADDDFRLYGANLDDSESKQFSAWFNKSKAYTGQAEHFGFGPYLQYQKTVPTEEQPMVARSGKKFTSKYPTQEMSLPNGPGYNNGYVTKVMTHNTLSSEREVLVGGKSHELLQKENKAANAIREANNQADYLKREEERRNFRHEGLLGFDAAHPEIKQDLIFLPSDGNPFIPGMTSWDKAIFYLQHGDSLKGAIYGGLGVAEVISLGVGRAATVAQTVTAGYYTVDAGVDMANNGPNGQNSAQLVFGGVGLGLIGLSLRGAPSTTTLRRPYIRQGVRAEVEARAPRTADGRFIDPNTGEPINGTPDLGHRPGHEFWREQARAQERGWTQQQFNDYMNNPDFYQLENPSTNRSHRFEQPR
jgi:RHS repeat-associated protein